MSGVLHVAVEDAVDRLDEILVVTYAFLRMKYWRLEIWDLGQALHQGLDILSRFVLCM